MNHTNESLPSEPEIPKILKQATTIFMEKVFEDNFEGKSDFSLCSECKAIIWRRWSGVDLCNCFYEYLKPRDKK
jgi:hypothetical protein